MCVCVCECDLQISTLKRTQPKMGCCATDRKRQIIVAYFEKSEHKFRIALSPDKINSLDSIIFNNSFRPKMPSSC